MLDTKHRQSMQGRIFIMHVVCWGHFARAVSAATVNTMHLNHACGQRINRHIAFHQFIRNVLQSSYVSLWTTTSRRKPRKKYVLFQFVPFAPASGRFLACVHRRPPCENQSAASANFRPHHLVYCIVNTVHGRATICAFSCNCGRPQYAGRLLLTVIRNTVHASCRGVACCMPRCFLAANHAALCGDQCALGLKQCKDESFELDTLTPVVRPAKRLYANVKSCESNAPYCIKLFKLTINSQGHSTLRDSAKR